MDPALDIFEEMYAALGVFMKMLNSILQNVIFVSMNKNYDLFSAENNHIKKTITGG